MRLNDVCRTSLNVDTTSWRCIDVKPMLYRRHVPAGKVENKLFCIRLCFRIMTELCHSITKTRLYNFDPLKPHFYTVKRHKIKTKISEYAKKRWVQVIVIAGVSNSNYICKWRWQYSLLYINDSLIIAGSYFLRQSVNKTVAIPFLAFCLAFTTLWANSADNKLMIFPPANRLWHFKQIVS